MHSTALLRFSLVGLCLSFGLIACASQAEKTETVSMESMRRATVLVENSNSHGTGIVLSDRWILTAEHVVNGENPEITFFEGEKQSGTVRWSSSDLDLALVETAIPASDQAPSLDCAAPHQGDLVTAVGHPISTRWVAVEGFIRETSIVESTKLMALGFPLSLGNSGGPVFDSQGSVVGVVSAILVEQSEYDQAVSASQGTYSPQSGIGAMIPANAFCDAIRAVQNRIDLTGVKIAQLPE